MDNLIVYVGIVLMLVFIFLERSASRAEAEYGEQCRKEQEEDYE